MPAEKGDGCPCGSGAAAGNCPFCGEGAPLYWCETCRQVVQEKRCPLCGLKARRLRSEAK